MGMYSKREWALANPKVGVAAPAYFSCYGIEVDPATPVNREKSQI